MAESVKRRRPYRSALREQRARLTKSRILEVAQALFLERGFAATTIAAIADEANVAPETIYATYGTKAALLENVVLDAVLRDDEPDEVLERRWVRALLELPELADRIAALARHTAETLELTGPVYAVIKSAGTGAAELDGVHRRLQRMRFGDQAKVLVAAVEDRSPRAGLTVQNAAETFSALASPEMHHLLTADRGWSQDRYAQWLERTTQTILLPP
jgi:AcrR family transcriptional regulator